jgi:uncharacterized protein YerC
MRMRSSKNIAVLETEYFLPEDGEIKTPFQFFKKMITNDMIQNLADQTNIYSLQRDGTSISTSNKEIEIIIDLLTSNQRSRSHIQGKCV